MNDFRDELGTALKNERCCQVQILLAERKGKFAAIRDAAVPGTLNVDAHLRDTIQRIEELKKSLEERGVAPHRVHVRFFDAAVPGPMLIVDDRRFVIGSFLQNPEGSPGSPAVWFERSFLTKADITDAYLKSFNRLWESTSE